LPEADANSAGPDSSGRWGDERPLAELKERAAPTEDTSRGRSRGSLRTFVGANVVQLNFVWWTLVAHAALLFTTAAWLELSWSPWLVAPAFLLSECMALRSCLPDRQLKPWARLLQEAGFVYAATVIVALPFVLVLIVIAALEADGPERAAFVKSSALPLVGASYLGAFLLTGWGVLICRRWVRITRTLIRTPTLPEPFRGYSIAHLTDLHVGSTDPRHVAERWVELTNRLAPDMVVITGDLVTKGHAFIPDVCAAVAKLRAPDGVFVCLGNHDQYRTEELVAGLEREGARVLRNRWTTLERGGARIVVAGVDVPGSPGEPLRRALGDRPPNSFTLLLAHYPNHFERLDGMNVQLVLSGHTHGGQIGVPLLGERFNVATLSGQRGRGLFQRQGSQLHVSAGLGTTGVPFRLGVRPEIALLRLEPAG
jgi:predicted MPP superfamily phosphohydrolase